MTISELVSQHGIGIYIGCVVTGILLLVLVAVVASVVWIIITLAISKSLEVENSICFDELRYVQEHFDELEIKVSELKCCQLSCKEADKNGNNNGTN